MSSASGLLPSCCYRGKGSCTKCSIHDHASQSSLHGMKDFSLPEGRGTAQITPAASVDGIYLQPRSTRVAVNRVQGSQALEAPSTCTTAHFHLLWFGQPTYCGISTWSHLALNNVILGCHGHAKRMAGEDVCLGAVMQPNLLCSKYNPAIFTCFGVSEQKFHTNLIGPRFLTLVSSYNASKRAISY